MSDEDVGTCFISPELFSLVQRRWESVFYKSNRNIHNVHKQAAAVSPEYKEIWNENQHYVAQSGYSGLVQIEVVCVRHHVVWREI